MTDQHDKTETAIQVIEPQRIATVEQDPGRTLAPVVSEILARNPTAETLGDVMALQERWEDREAKRAFIGAMIRLKSDLPPVLAKDKRVSLGGERGYNHTSLDALVRTVTPHLTRHGFEIEWDPRSDEKIVTVTLELSHVGGHSKRSTMSAPPDTGTGRNAVQARGSTVTYLQRYLLTAMLGIATGDVDDADDTPRAQSTTVDQAANIKAAAWLRGRGLVVEDAEGYLTRTVAEWTADDLAAIREWAKAQRDAKKTAASPPPTDVVYELHGDEERQPCEDDAPKTGRRTR